MKLRTFVAVCVAVLIPALASAQALTSIASVRVGYTTRKNTVKPQGELKAQIDALDAQIAEAARLGRSGDLRRLYAKGVALLNGRPWTDAADYSASLVLRTPRVVVDSAKPWTARLEADARRAPESVRADIRFPVDRMKNVNRGRLELRTFDPDRDLATAEAIAAAAKGGKDPFAGKTGDFKRHYLLDAAQEIIPYRMYVPTSYNGSKAYPLIVALHGLGGTEDAF